MPYRRGAAAEILCPERDDTRISPPPLEPLHDCGRSPRFLAKGTHVGRYIIEVLLGSGGPASFIERSILN